MQISTRTATIALFRMLAAEGMGPGDLIGMVDLQQRWKGTFLRRGDLASTLDSLVRGGAIRLEMGSGGPQVRLVHDRFMTSLDPETYQSEIRCLKQLAWVRSRGDRRAAGEDDANGHRRRFSDSPLAARWRQVSLG